MTLRKVWFSECVQHSPASTEMFSFITRSGSCFRSRRTSDRSQPSPKDPGGMDESVDLSRDWRAEERIETGRDPYSAFGPWRSPRPSAAEPDQRIRFAHGARALWLSAGVTSQPGH